MSSDHDRDSEMQSSTGAAPSAEPIASSGAPGAAGVTDPHLTESALGSGLLAQQPTPSADEAVAVIKVCPQCGTEYETGDRFCPKDGTSLRPKAAGDPLIGRVIADRYLVLARIGEGGMGRVYLAEHVKMTRQCAIKVMNPSLVNDPDSLHRFAREASNAARILHSNVAAVFDYGEADKIVYLVMEYVDGESLSTIIARDGPLDPRRAIDIARQVADGLSAAHELGIVHRDLKPDNVILTHTRGGKEIAKVVDFGIAKAIAESPQDALTRSGLVIGTPEYMSPEQLLGDPVDERADIYSLGCILYQMLTGAQAFSADTREQMIRRRLHETPPHVRDFDPALPRRLDTLIVHMLARSPTDRLASAAQARDQLDPALALGGWDPSSLTAPRRISPPPPRLSPLPRSSDPSLQPTMPMAQQKMSVKRIGLATLIGSALLASGLVFWSQLQEAPPTPAPVAHHDSVVAQQPAAAPVESATTPPPKTVTPAGTPARIAPLRPDTSVVHQIKVPVVPSDTAVLYQTFEPLANAISTEEINAVQLRFPNIPDAERAWFTGLFGRAANVRVKNRTYEALSIHGDSADVVVTLHISYRNKNAADPTTLQRKYRAQLVRADGGWKITALLPETR
ncbi:MAG TPA: serine/threonine-protein kinase [Gemmatimonadaceae bacterium]|jgi:serine/threonine-protein kinase|nr:serine/threonine-protein kinase [Gemmatimonadaceae bacterium]